MSDLHDVRLKLYARRFALGLSQRALAKRIGTTQSHVSDMETGKNAPGLDTLTRWAAALGLTLHLTVVDPFDKERTAAE